MGVFKLLCVFQEGLKCTELICVFKFWGLQVFTQRGIRCKRSICSASLSNTWENTQNDFSEEIWVHLIVQWEQRSKEKKRSWERVCLAPGHRAGSSLDYPQSVYQCSGSASSFPSPFTHHLLHLSLPTVFSGSLSFATSSALTFSASLHPPASVPPNWCRNMSLLNKVGRP